jgi:hypothetical protein
MGGKSAGTLTSTGGISHIKKDAPTFSQLHAREIHSERQNALQHGPQTVWPWPPSEGAPYLAQAQQEVEAAHQHSQRLSQAREKMIQSLWAISHAHPFVDLHRGVHRNGRLSASDIQEQIGAVRHMAHKESLSEACHDRIAKADRVVPKMPATIEFVSTYVH